MQDRYLIPANGKNANLIFGFFRPLDLIIFVVGVVISLFMLFILGTVTTVSAVLLVLTPVAVAGFLVFPVPNYHNILVLIQEIFYFFNNRRNYVWRGWCYKYAEKDEK